MCGSWWRGSRVCTAICATRIAANPEWRIALRPGLGGLPVTVSWDPQSLPEGAWRIRSLDGTQAIDVDMTTQGTVAIADPTVTQLAILRGVGADLTYAGGWSMISLPVTPTDNALGTLFPNAISAFRFAGSYQQVTTLAPCEGYWLNLPAGGGTYTLGGTAANPCSSSLNGGWSMIGAPYNGTAVADVQQSPGGNIISIFAFTGSYQQVDLTTGSLAAGAGYWVNLTQAGQLVMNSAQGGAARPVATPDPYLGPVLWARSGHQRQALQLGVDPNQVTALPPLPPAGVLDARVWLGDVSSSEVPASAVPREYPMTVQGEAVTLGWHVAAEASGRWELVFGNQTVPLSGRGSLALGDASPAQLILRQVAALPLAWSLHANYPNPFNPTTTIRYELKESGPVSLQIYAVTGQLVRELVAQVQVAGHHQVVWDGRNAAGQSVATGAYLYELRAGTFRTVRKMVLMK